MIDVTPIPEYVRSFPKSLIFVTYAHARNTILSTVWGEWTECTRSCGNGTQERTKTCGTSGFTCDRLMASCNLKPCNGMLLMALHDNNVLAA